MKLNRKDLFKHLTHNNLLLVGELSIGQKDSEEFPDEWFCRCYYWSGEIIESTKFFKKYGSVSHYCMLTRKGWNALKDEIIPLKHAFFNSGQKDLSLEEYKITLEAQVENIYSRIKQYPLNELAKLDKKREKIFKKCELINKVLDT